MRPGVLPQIKCQGVTDVREFPRLLLTSSDPSCDRGETNKLEIISFTLPLDCC